MLSDETNNIAKKISDISAPAVLIPNSWLHIISYIIYISQQPWLNHPLDAKEKIKHGIKL